MDEFMKTLMKHTEHKIPSDLHKALVAKPNVRILWDGLTPISQRDFLSWIVSAKQEETRVRRVERTCSMLALGKRRPCCYSRVPLGLYKALSADPKAKAGWSELTPDEKRDVVDWVEDEIKPGLAKQKAQIMKERIEHVCTALARGKKSIV